MIRLLVSCLAVSSVVASHAISISSRATSDLSTLFSCPAASWPAVTVGIPNTPQPVSDELASMLSQISSSRIEAIITKLVSFGTRHTQSSQTNATRGIGAARDWIASEMRGFAAASGGRMTVEVPSYIQQPDGRITFPTNISNIVATLKGSDDPGRVYVVSGHYDSRNTDVENFTDDAPGADDEYVSSLLLCSLKPHFLASFADFIPPAPLGSPSPWN